MRLNATAITWAQRGLLGLIIVAMAGFGLRATGKAVDTLDLVDGMVWLSSQRTGTVVQASSAARKVTARLEVAKQSEEIVTVQDGPSALVLNRSTGQVGRADGVSLNWRAGETFPASGSGMRLLSGEGAAFLVDGTQGKVRDLDGDLVSRRETTMGTGPVAALVSEAGLWLLHRDTGELALVQSEGRVRTASNLNVGKGGSLAMIGDRIFAVDPTRREVVEVNGDSLSPRRRYCLGGASTGSVVSLGSQSEAGVDRVVTLVPETGQILISDLETDKCSVVEIREGDSPDNTNVSVYGQPVVSGDLLFVPVSAKGEVIVVDLTERRVRRTIKVFPEGRRSDDSGAGTIELIVDGGTVWFNDPTGPSAGIIDGSGIVDVLDKYDADGEGAAAAQADGDPSLGVSNERQGEGVDLERDKGVEATERVRPSDEGSPSNGDGDGASARDGAGGTGGPGSGGTGPGAGAGGLPEVVVSPGEIPTGQPTIVALPEVPLQQVPPALAEADAATAPGVDPQKVPLPNAGGSGSGGQNGPGGPNSPNQPNNPSTTSTTSATTTTQPQRLTATFQFSAANAQVGEAIQFTDRSSGNPTSWQWNFGDGTSSDVRNPRKSYAAPGTYPVILTVKSSSDQAVSAPATISVVANAADTPPAISVAPSTAAGEVDETLTFSAGATAGRIVEWSWDWGDGNTGSGQSTSHAWKTAGSFRVTLTGRDAQGRQASATATVSVVTKTTAPEASFTYAPTVAVRGEPVSFTDTSRNDPTSVVWDFGDRTPQIKGARVSHIYAEAGQFTATAVVSNRKGQSSASRTVRVVEPTEKPVARFQVSNARPRVGEDIVLVSNSTGSPTRYTWTFSDGRVRSGGRELETLLISFPTPGEVTVELTVANETDSASTRPFTIVVSANQPPVRPLKATIAVSPSASAQEPAPVGTPIRFDDVSEGRILSWSWDLGDGATATGPSVSHAYARPGRYIVSLTISNGERTDSATRPIFVAGPAVEPVVADFAVSPEPAVANEPVAFTDRSRNGPVSWQWDFGDGTPSSVRNPTHVFAQAGVYTVSLVVTNELGQRDRATRRVLVSRGVVQPPVAVLDIATPVAERIAGRPITFADISVGRLGTPTFTVEGTVVPPTPGERTVQFTFAQAGTYAVQLKVCWADDPQNCGAAEATVTIAAGQRPPQAAFQIGPPSCLAPGGNDVAYVDCDLVLTSTSTPEGATLEWVIDGRTFTGPTVQYSQKAAGDIAVVLRATNVAGVSTATKIVRFVQRPPVAEIELPSGPLEVGAELRFVGKATSDVTSWQWDFESPTQPLLQLSGPVARVVFTQPGLVKVTLRATGPGGTSTVTMDITVLPSTTTTTPSSPSTPAPQNLQAPGVLGRVDA